MKKLLINVRYWFAPILIIVSMLGVLAGGMFAWVGLLLLGVGIVIDTLLRVHTTGAGYDENGETYGIPWLQDGVMYSMLGVFVLLQLSIAWRIFQYVNGVPISAGFDHLLFGILPYQEGITGLNLVGCHDTPLQRPQSVKARAVPLADSTTTIRPSDASERSTTAICRPSGDHEQVSRYEPVCSSLGSAPGPSMV